jgi:hypothetical protein
LRPIRCQPRAAAPAHTPAGRARAGEYIPCRKPVNQYPALRPNFRRRLPARTGKASPAPIPVSDCRRRKIPVRRSELRPPGSSQTSDGGIERPEDRDHARRRTPACAHAAAQPQPGEPNGR